MLAPRARPKHEGLGSECQISNELKFKAKHALIDDDHDVASIRKSSERASESARTLRKVHLAIS